jgi:hypothetical protein
MDVTDLFESNKTAIESTLKLIDTLKKSKEQLEKAKTCHDFTVSFYNVFGY